jgi:ParB family protein of integrating conjugative element (PFGI_1 class)
MADLTPEAMAAKLMATPFERASPAVAALSDPIADTPMVVTLDELKPYDLNPRVTRNPLYDDIKASIRMRGLDAPPSVTRRPGESHFIIRSGGNTRLSVLRELWAETKEERFFRIPCLFRPWSARGEIVALTGHLAENELQGGLTFIERALGVEKARELYEQESGGSLTQSELAQRLTEDGYPITQPHVSRMQDAVRYLLPAIPSILYAGLGKPQIERLASLRKGAERAWERHAREKPPTVDFPSLWREVLASFEGAPGDFTAERAQDELIGQLAELLGVDYDALALEIVDAEAGQRARSRELVLTMASESAARAAPAPPGEPTPARSAPTAPTRPAIPERVPSTVPATPAARMAARGSAPAPEVERRRPDVEAERNARIEAHIVSPVETTERLRAIERTIAEATGESAPDFKSNVLNAIPVQAGGLYPISDVWYIEPGLDDPERLRMHIAQFAREIAHEAGLAACIDSTEDGVGFHCTRPRGAKDPSPGVFGRAVLSLLSTLSAGYLPTPLAGCTAPAGCTPPAGRSPRPTIDGVRLIDDLAPLLLGPASTRQSGQTPMPGARPTPAAGPVRLSDVGLVKLFRLIRLARRLLEWESCDGQRPDDR